MNSREHLRSAFNNRTRLPRLRKNSNRSRFYNRARVQPCQKPNTRFALRLFAFLCLTLMPLFAQPATPANPEAIKKADTAFRAGYAAQQAGQLEEARAHFAEVVRLAPQIAEG